MFYKHENSAKWNDVKIAAASTNCAYCLTLQIWLRWAHLPDSSHHPSLIHCSNWRCTQSALRWCQYWSHTHTHTHTHTRVQTLTCTDVQNHLQCVTRLAFENQWMHEQTWSRHPVNKRLRCCTEQQTRIIHRETYTHTSLYMQTDKNIFPSYTATCAKDNTTRVYVFVTAWVYFWWSRLWNMSPEGWLPNSIAFASHHSNLSHIILDLTWHQSTTKNLEFCHLHKFCMWENSIADWERRETTLSFTINISTRLLVGKLSRRKHCQSQIRSKA